MSHLAKLSIAVVLALAAAGLNAMWLSAQKRPPTFVAAKTDIKAGQEIMDVMLAPIPVPGDVEKLKVALIPYANRAILLGLKAARQYSRGDIFFQRDIQAPLELAQFEVLGPFRLISVGERFKQAKVKPEDNQMDPGGNNVTIAVSANFDDRTRRLLQIIDPNQKANRDDKVKKIIAVQVIPADQQTPEMTKKDEKEVYQTISLQGIENVPRVLLEGEVIRFVVPVSDSL
jgi:hypothetical protein